MHRISNILPKGKLLERKHRIHSFIFRRLLRKERPLTAAAPFSLSGRVSEKADDSFFNVLGFRAHLFNGFSFDSCPFSGRKTQLADPTIHDCHGQGPQLKPPGLSLRAVQALTGSDRVYSLSLYHSIYLNFFLSLSLFSLSLSFSLSHSYFLYIFSSRLSLYCYKSSRNVFKIRAKNKQILTVI